MSDETPKCAECGEEMSHDEFAAKIWEVLGRPRIIHSKCINNPENA